VTSDKAAKTGEYSLVVRLPQYVPLYSWVNVFEDIWGDITNLVITNPVITV
jgi:hypothetical protein